MFLRSENIIFADLVSFILSLHFLDQRPELHYDSFITFMNHCSAGVESYATRHLKE